MGMERSFQCVFCDKTFTRRSWFDKHDCAKKKRFSEANNLTTIKAQKLYEYWCRRQNVKRKIKESPMKEFLNSPYFKVFKNLAEFTQTSYVVSAYKYMDWLILNKIPERRWRDPKNLDVFRTFTRDQEEVPDQVERTFRNIRAWCTENQVPLAQFFSKIAPLDALFMIRQNKLMPWVLFGSERAVTELVHRFSQEHLMALDEFVNLEYWLTKIEEYPDKVALVRRLSEEQLAKPA